MLVDVVLGLIFITAIICFTVYKINKNSVNKNSKYFTQDEDEFFSKDFENKKETSIGFQAKKDKRDDERNDKN